MNYYLCTCITVRTFNKKNNSVEAEGHWVGAGSNFFFFKLFWGKPCDVDHKTFLCVLN